ncbi:gliding motility-associated-like protein [Nonlabens dokdonensis]|uniref:Secreted protein containing PKD domain n=2 Tax=Nonlabens dokdonensis TaxID=328515 RepID=L7WCJ2_NONDD|nr:gliding motility-associated C-terminal domain-containing protein [Nonlabens dokdonensis]AGC77789.1 secreted protein containing PKD domain [Nonlabens dokdonensis DSW-6]PZX39677.1 gliding motility-associated-like protein [Nonlabens dokdonensis]
MKYFLYLLIFISSAFAKAQLESSFWYFGINAGIDFSSGTAVAIDNGQLVTGEGCATISDQFGNLLFYTDGSLVYDANHVIMPNGTGLKGNSSSTSSAIIVPLPGNPNIFYIFTVDTDDLVYRDTEGLHYSIVDMTLNGGTGDVDISNKNINLLPITSEKLTAISNASGDGFWIISQFEDRFFSYELTANGLSMTPVTSTVAPFIELVTTPITNVDVAAMRGYIKVNARGNKLVAAHFSNNTTAEFTGITDVLTARSIAYANGGELYLYDFDNSNGVVSNPQPLLTRQDGGSIYGVEFSGNGQYLYAEVDYMNASTSQVFDLIRGEIVQYDLTAVNVANSATLVHQDNITPFRGALQLGLDNKIYHSRFQQGELSVINNPDNAGVAANYTFNSFPLTQNATAWYGLPIFVQSFLLNGEIIAIDHCFGEEQDFNINTSASIVSINWDFGDPNSGANNISSELEPSHLFTAPGTYTITATVETLNQIFTTTTTIIVFDAVMVNSFPEKLEVCEKGFDQATFDLTLISSAASTSGNQMVNFYEQEEDAILDVNRITNPSSYINQDRCQVLFFRVSNENCFEIFSFEICIENCPIKVFNVLTPDGDGLNDTFIVSGLYNIYDKHKMHIFSRYGQKIWEGNNETGSWNGTSNTGLFSTGSRLPTGTYFYVIELNEPNTKPVAGYVYLQ